MYTLSHGFITILVDSYLLQSVISCSTLWFITQVKSLTTSYPEQRTLTVTRFLTLNFFAYKPIRAPDWHAKSFWLWFRINFLYFFRISLLFATRGRGIKLGWLRSEYDEFVFFFQKILVQFSPKSKQRPLPFLLSWSFFYGLSSLISDHIFVEWDCHLISYVYRTIDMQEGE